jgi:hypothetical protein
MANYPEYLERNALIERIKKAYCDGCESYNGVRCRACGIGDVIDVVEDAPTALERTAEWIVQDGSDLFLQDSAVHRIALPSENYFMPMQEQCSVVQ